MPYYHNIYRTLIDNQNFILIKLYMGDLNISDPRG